MPSDRVVPGLVVAAQPPQLAATSPALTAASVLVVVLGVLSLATLGLTSLPALVLGRHTLRRHGGWHWVNARDALLVACGMVMAALPLLLWLILLPLTL